MEEEYYPDGMLDSYLYESFQLLGQMEEIVLSGGKEDFFDGESINELFRIVHTIKSSSGIMMYDNIAYAAHKLEDIFYYLRESKAEDIPKAELSEYIFETSDFIYEELKKIKEGMSAGASPKKLVEKIENYLKSLKEEIREKGLELPRENIYVAPSQYYIAPASKKKEDTPLKIDLGEEPDTADSYVIGEKKAKRENLVGISMEKLEKLTALVEKLVKIEKKAEEETDFEKIRKKLRKVVEELNGTVTEIRQAPVNGIFRKMNRVIFDVSRKLAKEMELKTQGEDVTADRMILEHISEALMHIVRNAADHGIETREERRLAGKPEKGTIFLKAEKKEKLLYLSVRDDGRGLDKYKIFERAKDLGLVAREADMGEFTDEEIYTFITYAGFSTAEKVTEISGRGVGMDVVMNRLKEVEGILQIKSEWGKGTEMIMKIPLEE